MGLSAVARTTSPARTGFGSPDRTIAVSFPGHEAATGAPCAPISRPDGRETSFTQPAPPSCVLAKPARNRPVRIPITH